MPKGPKGEKRPADFVGAAVKVMRIATGEETERSADPGDKRDPAAVALGKRGGQARAKKLSKRQKSAIARTAARARWSE